MPRLSGKTVAILATDGFEQTELERPLDGLRAEDATVHVVAPDGDRITGWQGGNWGRPVPVDRSLDMVSADEYDALVLPGGVINPDLLRVNADAVALVRAFWQAGKPIGAICHGPWLLVEAGIARGRRMTGYKSIRTDVENAGARWQDAAAVVDQGLITSRDPDDLRAFIDALIEEIAEGRHHRREAA